jgi:hypothetical protein
MEDMPWQGATFRDAQIAEAARARLARQLMAIPDNEVRSLFRAARFPDYYSATDDNKVLEAWTTAFRHRRDQITATTCPS